jgi:uncharacterized protein
MVEKQNLIRQKVLKFYELIKKKYPVKKMILFGSYAKGQATEQSDIDVGVVIDCPDHLRRIEITSTLFRYAGKVDRSIEPKCIFWDEYKEPETASILSEIIRTGIEVV